VVRCDGTLCTMSHLFFYILLIFALPVCSQVKWDGGAGTDQWNDALNWNTNVVPSATDNVVLDNSIISSNYIVVLPVDAVTVKTILIDPAGSRNIELHLPKENKMIPGLTISGPGYALIINKGGIFRNSSGASSGTPLMVSDSIKINNDGRFIINTPRAHATNVDRISRAPGTEKGIVEFDIPDASTTISLSGRTYGKLVLKAAAFGRSLNYTAAGTSKVIIRSDLDIGDSVNFNLNFSDSILIKGDLIQGAATFNTGNTARNVVIGVGGDISVLPNGRITETGTGIQQLLLNGIAEQQINIQGQINNQIIFAKNSVSNAKLLSPLNLAHALYLHRGNIISTAANVLILQSECTVQTDSLSDESFIDGPVKKEGLLNGAFMFPVGKSGKMRWLELLSATGTFTVEYINTNPKLISNTMGAGIDHISGIEHWSISGDNSAIIKLSFHDPNSGGVTVLSQLRVARLQSGAWQNAGNTDFRGTPGTNGWVSSSAAGGFSAGTQLFALASAISQENPLPVLFKQFTVNAINNKTIFTWLVDKDHTATRFELQESTDNYNYYSIYSCEAKALLTDYYYQCDILRTGKKYYRVRAIDKDGSTNYFSKILFLNAKPLLQAMNTKDITNMLNFRIIINTDKRVEILIHNEAGQLKKKVEMNILKGTLDVQIMVGDLAPGMYVCSMISEQERIAAFKFIKR
jgi:hypothetical protein